MSQKWSFRGPERTFFPLRGLREERLFIAKGTAREKKCVAFEFFLVFTLDQHTKVLHLMGSIVNIVPALNQRASSSRSRRSYKLRGGNTARGVQMLGVLRKQASEALMLATSSIRASLKKMACANVETLKKIF